MHENATFNVYVVVDYIFYKPHSKETIPISEDSTGLLNIGNNWAPFLITICLPCGLCSSYM